MMKNTLTVKQKEADQDLNIISLLTVFPLFIFLIFQSQIMRMIEEPSFSIWLRLLFLAAFQFSIAGLGSSLVMILRRENWRNYGLTKKNAAKSISLSALLCLPLILFLAITGQIHSYLPFQTIILTKEVLAQSIPLNIIGYSLIALIWGFFEAFNYLVIANKINCRYPSHQTWLDYGALTCALICLIIHGIIGFDLHTILESLTVFVLIYGMLIVHKKTGNAWGCILIFLFIWNAF